MSEQTYFPDAGAMTHDGRTVTTFEGWWLQYAPYGSVQPIYGAHPEFWADQPPYGTYVDSQGVTRQISNSYGAATWWDGVGCWMEASWLEKASPEPDATVTDGFVRFEGRVTNFRLLPGGGADPVYPTFLTVTASIAGETIWQESYDPLVNYTPIAQTVALEPEQAAQLVDGTGEPLRWDLAGPSNGMSGHLELDTVALNVTWEAVAPPPSILGDQRGKRRIFW